MKFIITVDTEADNQWEADGNICVENLSFLPRFHNLSKRYNYKPSYLVTYEVVENNKSNILRTWQDNDEAEVGAHLHPWTTPPIKPNEPLHSFPSELEEDVLEEKIITLTNAIKNKFGINPISFRAGRWGFNNQVAKILIKYGYKVDCSVTPYINWQNVIKKGNVELAPNFSSIGPQSYIIDNELLELPMTVLYTRRGMPTILTKTSSLYPVFMRKYVQSIFGLKWLRIYQNTTIDELKSVILTAQRLKLPYIQFMVHSSELMPGGSKYFKNEESVERFYNVYEKLLKLVSDVNIKSSTLAEFYNNFDQ